MLFWIDSLSMLKQTQPQRRRRGVVLSSQGWRRLQGAEQQIVDQVNAGKPYTLEQLGQRVGLSPNTITKVRQRRLSVDRQTLEAYFSALGLILNADDYVSLDSDSSTSNQFRSPLRGQVPLGSPYYVERPPAESNAREEILQPGALIRIRAPHQLGKTSLMARVLADAHDQGFRSVVLSLQLADTYVLKDLNRFMRWFCAVVTRNLQLPSRLEESWNELFGASYNCTDYFENYLLTTIESPLVIALDGLEAIFTYPEVAADFLSMLRAWYEKARYGSSSSVIWQRLRLMLVHSTEVYLPLNHHQSPFNVGTLIDLPTFTLHQVRDLAQRYGIEAGPAEYLWTWLGGFPYLTQSALYCLSSHEITLEQLSQTAISVDGVFGAHLRQQFGNLQPYPELLTLLRQIVLSEVPIELNPLQAFKLQSMGLVRLNGLQAAPSCRLYRQFFAQVLQMP
jgi:transcriptional regulator with XRE-family HTH domain